MGRAVASSGLGHHPGLCRGGCGGCREMVGLVRVCLGLSRERLKPMYQEVWIRIGCSGGTAERDGSVVREGRMTAHGAPRAAAASESAVVPAVLDEGGGGGRTAPQVQQH